MDPASSQDPARVRELAGGELAGVVAVVSEVMRRDVGQCEQGEEIQANKKWTIRVDRFPPSRSWG